MNNPNRNCDYEQINEATHQTVKSGAQDEAPVEIFGYKTDQNRAILYHLIGVIGLGIPYILACWFPILGTFKYKKCALITANVIIVCDDADNYTFLNIWTNEVEVANSVVFLRYFTYKHNRFFWIPNRGHFGVLEELIPQLSLETLVNNKKGLLESEEKNLAKIYGPNTIEVQVKSYWRLFVEEVFNPFYVFQAFSVILWFFDDYMIYALCVLFLTLLSVFTSLLQTKKQSIALHDLVKSSNSATVDILKAHLIFKSEPMTLDSAQLLPGHIIIIPSTGCIMPCDAVLLTGECRVNESMLTGESVTVLKTPPSASPELYDPLRHWSHTLFAGTQVKQARIYQSELVIARVVKTGFDTAKGSLVRSIMFPSPLGFKFYRDSLKFVMILFAVAATGMAYTFYLYTLRSSDVREMIIRALDIITIVVPPALPAAMTVGSVYSQNRLKTRNIFCISPPRINICGKIKLACFDKTGTLTDEGLNLYAILPCTGKTFSIAIHDTTLLDERDPIIQTMATCHSLTRTNRELEGDPLDLSMFLSTKWLLDEAGPETTNFDRLEPTVVKPYTEIGTLSADTDEMSYEIGILRKFPFSSSLQRMSVIGRILGHSNMILFTKGAPEKIHSMCLEETLPLNFSTKLAEFTAQGFRVIALAYKKLPANFTWQKSQKAKRQDLESDLIFLGFAVLENMLKEQTTPVISCLHAANIRTVMITGDNIMTAVCVARKCGMIGIYENVIFLSAQRVHNDQVPNLHAEYLNVVYTDTSTDTVINFSDDNFHFALDGNTWTVLNTYYNDLLPKILLRGTVFARFDPDQKSQLIRSFQSIDYVVSMVGDGANDCGALKAANVGVSLSPAEASVAAPFTSKIENISCLLFLIMEGRCALVTSFAIFKYMAMYSLIQFCTIIILYKFNSILGDQQFLFIDLVITTSLAVTLGRRCPSKVLVAKRPTGSLISGTNLVPLLLQIFFCGFIQCASLYYLFSQKWFIPNPPGAEEIVVCWENTVLFIVSSFQYVILALVYSKSGPYTENILSNFWLLFCSLSLICFSTYLCIYPSEPVADFFDIMFLPLRSTTEQHLFRDNLLWFPIAHLVIAIVIELIGDSKLLKAVVHFVTRKKKPKNRYKNLSSNLNEFPFTPESKEIHVQTTDL